ncbi:MAG: oxidoreductase [Bacteroidota bacterium]|nr:oxidoreductase [Bacteroidota bacterium]
MVNIAIIGYGYWGPNLVRNFSSTVDCRVHTVVDFRQERLQVAKRNHAGINVSVNPDDVFNNKEVDAIVIATPVFTHFDLAKRALEQDKHVLLEKPMTSSVAEAEELIALSEKHKKVLMVDHTFLYTGAVQRIKRMIEGGEIGKIKYFDSTRINLGLFQPDVNVLWDLAAHDIAILNYLVAEKPAGVQATGISHTHNGIENIAYLTINYNSDFIAHFSCSWTSPVKIRLMLIGGDEKMIVFNDLEPTEKIKIYDSGYHHQTDEEKNKILVDYRAGDIFIPKVESKEALAGMATDFVSAILHNTTPVSNCDSGLEVIKILEAAQQSIKNKGREVVI